MKTSQGGLDLIRSFEGLELEPYLCPAGKWTIGYGHVLLEGEPHKPITVAEALALLALDVVTAEKAVSRFAIGIFLTQNQFDALVSFTFNVGIKAFAESTLLKRVQERDRSGAVTEFLRWIHDKDEEVPGLKRRRKAESELYLG